MAGCQAPRCRLETLPGREWCQFHNRLTHREAAAALGLDPDDFEARVAAELRHVRRSETLIPVAEIDRWRRLSKEKV